MIKQKFFVFMSMLMTSYNASAQLFTPDKNGYVDDPHFKEVIKTNGYSAVGVFSPYNGSGAVADALKNGVWIKINIDGKTIQPSKNIMTKNGVYGDKGEDDNFNPFTYVHPSNAGLLIVKKNGKEGLTNKNTNKIIIPDIYDKIQLTNFKFVAVEQNGKWGTISKDGSLIVPPKYDEIRSLGVNMRGTSNITGDAEITTLGNKVGLLSENGEEIIAPKFDKIKSSWILSSMLTSEAENKWGLLNKSGKELIEPIYFQINDFDRDGFAIVSLQENGSQIYGMIDSLGNELLKPIYKRVFRIDKKLLVVTIGVLSNVRMGLVNMHGKALTPIKYVRISNFYNGVSIVQTKDNKEELFGCIDTLGQEVIKPIYRNLEDPYRLGVYKVKTEGKFGLLTVNKGFILTPQFDEMENSEGKYTVKKNDKFGMINQYGKFIIPLKFELSFRSTDKNGIYQTYSNGKKCLVDLYGDEVFY